MIIVTGGAGFIGSHLCEKLLKNKDNEKVICIDNFNDYYDPKIKRENISTYMDNEKFILYKGDIRDIEFLEDIFSKNKISMVINLAAMAGVRPSLENPLLYEEVNVRGLMNLLEMCKKYKVHKFIQASSSSVYGNNKKLPFSEKDSVDFTISPYAATKKTGEVIGYTYHDLYDIDMIQLRFFTVYGPRQRPDLAINKFTRLIFDRKPIPFYGDGSSRRDYTYIDDIIDGIMKSISYVKENRKVYEIFNLGESQTISLTEMIKVIQEEIGLEAKLNRMPMQSGDVKATYADISKAKQILGYNPKTDFRTGIRKFLLWYTNCKNLSIDRVLKKQA